MPEAGDFVLVNRVRLRSLLSEVRHLGSALRNKNEADAVRDAKCFYGLAMTSIEKLEAGGTL